MAVRLSNCRPSLISVGVHIGTLPHTYLVPGSRQNLILNLLDVCERLPHRRLMLVYTALP